MLCSFEDRRALMSDAVRLYLGSPMAQITPSATRQHHCLPNSGPSGMSLSNFFTTVSKVLMNTLGSKVPSSQLFPSPSPVLGAGHPEASVCPCSLAAASNVRVSGGSRRLCVGHTTPGLPWPCYSCTLLSSLPAAAPSCVSCQGLCYQGEGCPSFLTL